MRYLEDFQSQEFVRTIGGLELIGMTWDDAIAELRVTLDDRSSPMPLHAQVAARLQELIETGGLPVGARIQSEVTLAERLGISRPTMRRLRARETGAWTAYTSRRRSARTSRGT